MGARNHGVLFSLMLTVTSVKRVKARRGVATATRYLVADLIAAQGEAHDLNLLIERGERDTAAVANQQMLFHPFGLKSTCAIQGVGFQGFFGRVRD